MVNEINKPETDPLTERLSASSRQLREMQEEHRQLLQEMEVLRARATELSRLNEQRQDLQQRMTQSHQVQQNVVHERATTSTSIEGVATQSTSEIENKVKEINQNTTNANTKILTEQLSTASKSTVSENHAEYSGIAPEVKCTDPTKPVITSSTSAVVTESGSEILTNAEEKNSDQKCSEENSLGTDSTEAQTDTESQEYLQQKIAEIAALKAQFKRVEHMISTTDLIEKHLKSKTTDLESVAEHSGTVTQSESSKSTYLATTSAQPSISLSTNSLLSGTSENSKEELLSAMLTMFTDFSDDLRSQAENLRAERERIRVLKEELKKRRK